MSLGQMLGFGEGRVGVERRPVLAHHHLEAILHRQPVPVGDHLGNLEARVDVHERKGDVPEEGLARQPQQDRGVLANGPQHAQALEVTKRFPEDVNALLLELIEVIELAHVSVAPGTAAGVRSMALTRLKRTSWRTGPR